MSFLNSLFCGDNLEILREYVPDESVDLIYIDPPFFSNRHYAVIWGDEAELRSFEDTWEGGIESYIGFLEPRLLELKRVLKPDGSLYVHCDWHASHRIRLLLDKIFGEQNFLNEIIWYYRGGGVSKKYFARRHDTIYFYAKSCNRFFNQDESRLPYAPTTEELFEYHIGNVNSDRDSEEQELHPTSEYPDDVWQIQPIAPSAKERLGYPTQKPEKLLERIIKASSREGDIVLDCFCGCGTTLAVAHKLHRQWVGIDISYTAIELVKERLERLGVINPPIIGMPITVEDALRLKPFDFQTWILKKLHAYASPKKVGDMGIDGVTYFKQLPIQIKKSEHIGRNVIDNFYAALQRQGKKKGFIIGISFGSGAVKEVHRLKNSEGVEIVLLPLEDVMGGYRIEE
ncbi:MAG: DNA methyltransferase [Calditrichota bacterium]